MLILCTYVGVMHICRCYAHMLVLCTYVGVMHMLVLCTCVGVMHIFGIIHMCCCGHMIAHVLLMYS